MPMWFSAPAGGYSNTNTAAVAKALIGPVSKQTIVNNVTYCNPTASPVTFSLYRVPSGGGECYFLRDFTLDPGALRTGSMDGVVPILNVGESLTFVSDTQDAPHFNWGGGVDNN